METAIARHAVLTITEAPAMSSAIVLLAMATGLVTVVMDRVAAIAAGLGQLAPRQTVQTPEQYLVVMAVEHAMGPVTVLAIQDGATHIVLRVLMVGREAIVMSLIVLA